MKRAELDRKYGKKLIEEIFEKGLLNGCTMGINKDGSEEIYECDIDRAIRELKGEKIKDGKQVDYSHI